MHVAFIYNRKQTNDVEVFGIGPKDKGTEGFIGPKWPEPIHNQPTRFGSH